MNRHELALRNMERYPTSALLPVSKLSHATNQPDGLPRAALPAHRQQEMHLWRVLCPCRVRWLGRHFQHRQHQLPQALAAVCHLRRMDRVAPEIQRRSHQARFECRLHRLQTGRESHRWQIQPWCHLVQRLPSYPCAAPTLRHYLRQRSTDHSW